MAKAGKKTFLRLIRTIFGFFPVLLPLVLIGILFNAIVGSIPAVFMQKVIAVVEQNWQSGDWNGCKDEILRYTGILLTLYGLALAASIFYNRKMAEITQGTLKKLREKMFNSMQDFPVKYFDTHNHGDIMSYYTNDIDTLRQLISQSIPQFLNSAVMVTTVFCVMLYYSIWMALVVVAGVVLMLNIIKKVGGSSAKFFIQQQKAIGRTEGFVEEMMNGQKVIKVFCHEEESEKTFDAINDELFHVSETANKYANTLGPILNNIGNLLYVAVALAGSLFLMLKVPNFSISRLPFSISIVVPFLNMTKQFAGNINQVSQQINAVVMGMAGAERIFSLLDEKPEEDEGYVCLLYTSYVYNLILFKEISRYFKYYNVLGFPLFMINIVGNIIAFAPFGFFLPVISRRSKKWYNTVTFGFTWSLILETLQLIFKVGSFDVDDLFLNTLGAAFGFGCYCLVQQLRYRRKIH